MIELLFIKLSLYSYILFVLEKSFLLIQSLITQTLHSNRKLTIS